MSTVQHERISVLDLGYIQLVEHWGSDQTVIEAARMSTAKGFEGWGGSICPACIGRPNPDITPFFVYADGSSKGQCTKCNGSGKTVGDEKLLRFLWDNHHATPFEMAGLIVEVKAPILVFREWHRHRAQGYSEMSARYTPLPDENYVPSVDRMLANQGDMNKQAGTMAGSSVLTRDVAQDILLEERAFNEAAQRFYEKKLVAGVPKELARTHLAVSRYSRMRATSNLRNWLAFLTLRQAPNAQYEIRAYANKLAEIVQSLFPRTWDCFTSGKGKSDV